MKKFTKKNKNIIFMSHSLVDCESAHWPKLKKKKITC